MLYSFPWCFNQPPPDHHRAWVLFLCLPAAPLVFSLQVLPKDPGALFTHETTEPRLWVLIYKAKIWKQCKCPSTDKWIKKMGGMWGVCVCVCMYVCIYVYICMYICIYMNKHTQWNISHKKEWNSVICSNVDGPREYYTYWNKSGKNILNTITYK